jgi:hypothetical protein
MEYPTAEENPHGLHRRYTVQKCNGEPVDPEAFYWVMRLDGNGRDRLHIKAGRAGARAYANFILSEEVRTGSKSYLGTVALELLERLDKLEKDDPLE